jgi:hypothetical protein
MSEVRLRVAAILLACVALSPLADAASAQGRAYGADAFYASAGVWDVYYFDHLGGHAAVGLTWEQGVIGVDYDLTLYRPGALDDGVLEQSEVVARSWTFGWDVRHDAEAIALDLPGGKYVISVEPIQAQGQRYVLTTNNGWLNLAALAPGVKGWPP